ncbi:hypothetical protein [Reinekea blandensis]|uniref:Uncharacterized protein n=1 Tax=Reinekea blandensis MED297 TaxID=314283 RepID=A4BAS0_9GAMM|nr:hypothetical protein [Reinekea blandensis]EAR11026.1 hypothetical protein MED297_10961 [Reinekea sp. MED297] [Reinekea blandensis MED297]
MSKLLPITLAVLGFAFGIMAANSLLERLAITHNTEREFLISQVSQSLKPQNETSRALQQAIYQQRIDSLESRIQEVEQKNRAVGQYVAPLESELQTYRAAFADKARASQDERLQLYIDLVNKYRDYHQAMTALDSFVTLEQSDSLLSLPSVQLDLVYDAGGQLANTHNQFINEPRDASFAARYELPLRRFLAQQELNVSLAECHQSLCAVHLGHVWSEPFYEGFDVLWDQLSQQPWMDLQRVGKAHQYRGKGHQVEVWYLQGATP